MLRPPEPPGVAQPLPLHGAPWSLDDVAWDPHTLRSPPGSAPVACRVPGCGALGNRESAYAQHVGVCSQHLRAEAVALEDGAEHRFCQKCNRFQPLADFSGGKHSCAAALDRHNARRRNARTAARAAKAAAAGLAAAAAPARTDSGADGGTSGASGEAAVRVVHGSLNGGATSSAHGASGSSGDASADARNTTAVAPDAGADEDDELLAWLAAALPVPGEAPAPAPQLPRSSASAAHHQLAHAATAVRAAASALAAYGCTVHIKLPRMSGPWQLPAEALNALLHATAPPPWCAAALPDARDNAAPPTGSVRPGCVLLTLDALLVSDAAAEGGGADAARVAAEALAPAFAHVPGGLAAGATVHVGAAVAPLFAPPHAPADEAADLLGGIIAVTPCAVALEAAPPQRGQQPQEVRLRVSLPDAPAGGRVVAVHARLHGHALHCDFVAADASPRALAVDAVVRLPAGGGALGSVPEGPLLVELLLSLPAQQQPQSLLRRLRRAAGAALQPEAAVTDRFSRTAAVLLCADAAAAAQVAATGVALAAGDDSTGDALAALYDVLRVIGTAIAPAPASRRVRCAAAAAAVCMGWDTLLTRLLAPTAAGGDGDGSAAADDLAVVVHALRGASSAGLDTSRACTRALAAARARAAPAGAWRRASEALVHATHACGHARPDCAAAAAEDEVAAAGDTHAACLLRAILTLIYDAADDAVAQAGELVADDLNDSDSDSAPSIAFVPEPPAAAGGAPAEWPDADELAYRFWLGRENVRTWVVVMALQLANAAMKAANVWRFVLHHGVAAGPPASLGVFSDAMLLATRLYRRVGEAATLALLSPRDVPWPTVVSHARVYFAATLLWRLPTCAAGLALALRWSAACQAAPHAHARAGVAPPRYPELLLSLVSLSEVLFLVFTDMLIMRATGAAPDWPPVLCAIEAVALIVLHWRGPSRPLIGVPVLLARAASVALPLAAARAWAPLLSLRSGAGPQLAAFAVTVAIAPARGRAMRAEWAAARAAERAARSAHGKPGRTKASSSGGATASAGGSDSQLRRRKPAGKASM